MKYAWIDGARDTYPLAALCRVLSVSTSGFADWKSCDGPTQWLSDDQLLALIRSIHAEVKGSYGSPRMLEELKARGFPASKGRVRRLMQAGSVAIRRCGIMFSAKTKSLPDKTEPDASLSARV